MKEPAFPSKSVARVPRVSSRPKEKAICVCGWSEDAWEPALSGGILSCRVRLRHAKTAPRPLNRPTSASKIPRAPVSLSVDKALPWSWVDDAVSPASSQETT